MPKKQKSGLYRTKVKIGVNAEGKPIYKYVSGRTKAELERNRDAVVRYYIKGEAGGDDVLFGAYAKRWFETYKVPNVSPATVASYRTALNKYLFPVFALRNLRSISATDIQSFLNGLSGTNGTMISICMACFKGIFASAYTDRIISHNPAAYMIRPEASEPVVHRTALTPAQRTAVEAACATHRYGALLALLYYTGMRLGEVKGLMWQDIDFPRRRIRIERDIDPHTRQIGKCKTPNAIRTIPLPDKLAAILSPLRAMPSMFVLGHESPISDAVYARMWITLMIDLGFAHPSEKKRKTNSYHYIDGVYYECDITAHTMRHNYVTMLWESGVDAYTTMRLVGHGDISTTLNIYTHLTGAQIDKTRDTVNAVFDPEVAKKLQKSDFHE